jgi:hypothetical protein
MNPAKERRAIDTALDSYRQQLDALPDALFNETPAMGGWSYSEVYDHILKATLGSSIALERCTHNNCQPTSKGMNFWGWYTMLTGKFPPIKAEVPQELSAKSPVTKISKEDAKNLIIKCRKRIESTGGLVKNAPATARHKHPRLGMLNAGQWFKFIRVHLEHHLKQLERIKNNFHNARNL